MFDAIAPQYDRFNSWASFGLHYQWRSALVRRIPANARVLDVATGTGDVAFLAAAAGHEVVGLDFSEGMLSGARQKDVARRIRWIQASADRLPFSDRSFGCVTSAFALRNIRGTMDAAFRENARVLQPRGKVLHLDFGRPDGLFTRFAHRVHLKVGVPFFGKLICGDRWPEGYLDRTIESFFTAEEVCQRLTAAGFTEVCHHSFLFGAVRLYEGVKPE